MKKTILCILFVIMVMLSYSLPAFAELSNDEVEIKQTINHYFEFQHQILSKLNSQNEISKIIHEEEPFISDQFLNQFACIMEMTIMLRSAQPADLTYDKYNFEIRYDNISINNDSACVTLFIVEKINFNADPSITSEAGTKHQIELVNQENLWTIASDKYELDGVGDRYHQLKSKYHGDPQVLTDAILADYSLEVEAGVQDRLRENEENPYSEDIQQESTRTLTAHTYNPGSTSSPITYAHTYCRTSNPSPWYTYSADCTNFTSIAIHQIIPKDSTGNTWYFNSTSDKTASWTSAQYFRQYIYKNNSSSTTNSGIYGKHDTYSNCNYGDIIQYASDPSNTWSTDGRPKTTHGSIVTKVQSGLLYVSMHSYGSDNSEYRYDYLVDSMPYTSKIYLNIVRYYD